MPTPEQSLRNSYLETQMTRRRVLRIVGAAVAIMAGVSCETSKPETDIDKRNPSGRYLIRVPHSHPWYTGYYTWENVSEREYNLYYSPSPMRVLATLAILGVVGAIIGPKIGLSIGDRFFLTPEQKEEKQRIEQERAQWRAQLAGTTQVAERKRKELEDSLSAVARNNLEAAKRLLVELDTKELLEGFKREVWGKKGSVDTIDGRFQTNGTIEQWPGFRLGFNHYTWRREERPEHTEYREGPVTIWMPPRDLMGQHLPGYQETIGTKVISVVVPYKTWLEKDKKMRSYVQVTAMDTNLVVSHNHDDTQPELDKTISIDLGEGTSVVAQRLKEALVAIANFQIENKLLPKDLKEKEDRQKASI